MYLYYVKRSKAAMQKSFILFISQFNKGFLFNFFFQITYSLTVLLIILKVFIRD